MLQAPLVECEIEMGIYGPVYQRFHNVRITGTMKAFSWG